MKCSTREVFKWTLQQFSFSRSLSLAMEKKVSLVDDDDDCFDDCRRHVLFSMAIDRQSEFTVQVLKHDFVQKRF